jgi:thymidylate synthase (FAD)
MSKIKLLDKGYVEIVNMMGNDSSIVNAARVSYLSKGGVKDKKLLFYLMQNNHSTPFEMVEFKFRVKCPLFVARQWMRHRTWSYNEISRRYTSEDIEFYIPDSNKWRLQSNKNKQSSGGFLPPSDNDSLDGTYFTEEIYSYCTWGFTTYQNALANGMSCEMARMFLPINMYTTFIAKVDAHNLMHFLKLRMSDHAQYEIRVYAEAIYNNFFKPNLQWTSEAFEKYRLNKKVTK